jgi:hypothetical protein
MPSRSAVASVLSRMNAAVLLVFLFWSTCCAASKTFLYPVPVNGKYGFMDRSGRMVIQPRFDHVRLFSEATAVVAIGGKYGYIDERGQQIISFQYENAEPFSEGLAAVQSGQKWGYIDKSGRWIIEPRFGSQLGGAGSFSEGLAPVLFDGKMGYIDHSGHIAIEPRFGFAEEFSEGLAAVGMVLDAKQDSRPKFGYIDKTGKLVVPLTYAGAHSFHTGLAVVSIYRTGVQFYPQAVIDHTGKQIIGPLNAGISDFHEGLAMVGLDQGIGFIDHMGKQVILPRFRAFDDTGPSDFSEGLAAVSLSNGKSGYISRTGEMAIHARFAIACPFMGGLALVFESDGVGYIDKVGNYIWTAGAKLMPGDEEPGCSW